ncbi:MAG: MotA/TolQ/ExbB proton channel family protein [Acidobacteriota bacterium]|nr:MotA/TolQ/ExbB proton channel family protein [Acidobacteriota bacterium]
MGSQNEKESTTRITAHKIFLKSLVLFGVISFVFAVLGTEGLLALVIESDRSRLSIVIMLIYVIASVHWLLISWDLSCQRVALDLGGDAYGESRVAHFLKTLTDAGTRQYEALADRLQNRHTAGHFIADALLKLGLLGTIIGFILMLLPVAQIEDFDTNLVQQLRVQMSAGMAVALYTTLAGLVTSTLLKLQYLLADNALSELLTDLSEKLESEQV